MPKPHPHDDVPTEGCYHPIGLPNLGNTCYMNSALQSLGVVFAFLFRSDWATSSSSTSSSPLTGLLFSLFHPRPSSSITDSDTKVGGHHHRGRAAAAAVLEPHLREIKTLAAARNRSFDGDEECDAHEFFRTILDILHDEHNTGTGRDGTYKEIKDQQRYESQSAAAARWYSIIRSRDCSPVTDVFYGQQCTTVTCTSCGNKIHTFDQFSSLHIAVPEEEGVYGGSRRTRVHRNDKTVKKKKIIEKKGKDGKRKGEGKPAEDKKTKKHSQSRAAVRSGGDASDAESGNNSTNSNDDMIATAKDKTTTLQMLVRNHLREVLVVDGYRCPQCCPSSPPPAHTASSGKVAAMTNNNNSVTVHVSTHHLTWPTVLVVHMKRFNYDGEKILSSFVPPDELQVPTSSSTSHNGTTRDEEPHHLRDPRPSKHKSKRHIHNVRQIPRDDDDDAGELEQHTDGVDDVGSEGTGAFLPYRKVATAEHQGHTIESGHYTATVLSAVGQAAILQAARRRPPPSPLPSDLPFVHCNDESVHAGDGDGANAAFVLYVRCA